MEAITPELQRLLDQSAESDLKSALLAKENARRRLHEDPSGANVAAFERASALLERLQAGKGAGSAADAGSKPFSRLSDVVKWLKDQGYKIGKSKLYQDAKSGMLNGSDADGYTLDAVLAYAHTQMLDKVADPAQKIDVLTEKRLQKEVEKLTAQVEKLQFELQRDRGKYLPKDEVRTELALKVAAFEAATKHMIRVEADGWIEMVGGNLERKEAWVGKIYDGLDRLLGEMGACEELDLIVKRAN